MSATGVISPPHSPRHMGRRAGDWPDTAAIRHHWPMPAVSRLEFFRISVASTRHERSCEQVSSIHQRRRDYIGSAFAWARLAEIERAAGELDEAVAAMDEAERLSRLLFGEGPNLAMMLSVRAQIAMDQGDDERASVAFAEIASIGERMRRDGSHLAAAEIAAYLDFLLERASSEPGTAAEAFRVSQLVRGPVVDKAMRQMTARLASDDPEIAALVRRLQGLRMDAGDVRLELGERRLDAAASGTDDPGLPGIEQQLAQLIAEQEGLERELQSRFPRFGGLSSPALVSIEEVTERMAPGEGLLRFVSAKDATYALLLTADGIAHAHRSSLGSADLAARVADIRHALTFAEGLRPFDIEASHALYSDLIGELDQRLAALSHVAVVTDGALSSLPPALFVREVGASYTDTAWLGRDVAVSIVGSIEAFVATRRDLRPSRAAHAFLGIGDPVLAGSGGTSAAVSRAAEACRDGGVLDPRLLESLPSLPETADELRLVSATLADEGNRLEMGRDATEAVVKNLPLSDYRVISFATHGLLPGELPCNTEPALVLTPPATGSDDDNGLLDASEIAALELDADWVVLSACNTAGPDGQLGGEALSGLATAFIHAGARSMLVSHWDVASDSTVRLMRRTFETYATALGPASRAKALQRAQVEMMGDPRLAHPAFWAAFTLVGDSGSLPESAAGPLAEPPPGRSRAFSRVLDVPPNPSSFRVTGDEETEAVRAEPSPTR